MDDEEALNIPSDVVTFSDEDEDETSINMDEETDENNESSSVSNNDDVDLDYSHSVGVDAEIPEEFPIEDLPIPKGATVTLAQDMSIDSNERITIIYVYNGDVDQLVEMYRDHFENGGFDEVNDSTKKQNEYGGGTALQIFAKKDGNDYTVEISAGGMRLICCIVNGNNSLMFKFKIESVLTPDK